MLTPLDLLKEQVKNSRETFESTAADIKEDHLHKDPGGLAPTLAGAYAHLIFSEDVIVQGMIQNASPLFESVWKDKTGASEPMPSMDENWSQGHAKWSKSVRLDMAKFREYAQAVHAATDEYINYLTNDDLEKDLDLNSLGMGNKPLRYILFEFVVAHTNSLAGELSAIKGVLGEKGYPF